MAWFGMELKDNLVPTPCHGEGCQPLNQALHQTAQGPIQPGQEDQEAFEAARKNRRNTRKSKWKS